MSVPAVPQRREHQHDDAEAMIELLAEPPLLDQGRQVLAGGHEEPDLAARRGMPGARAVVAELQVAEQEELQLDGQRGHVVEVERAAAGRVELGRPETRAESVGPAAGLPEASGIRDLVGQRRGLAGDEGPVRVRTRGHGSAGPAATCRCRARRRSGPAPASTRWCRPARRPVANWIVADQSEFASDRIDAGRCRRRRPPAAAAWQLEFPGWGASGGGAGPATGPLGAAVSRAEPGRPRGRDRARSPAPRPVGRDSHCSSACKTAARSSAAGTGYFSTAIAPSRSASLARSGCGRGNSRTTGTSRCLRRTYVSSSSASPSAGSTPARTRSMLVPLHQADRHAIVGGFFDDVAQRLQHRGQQGQARRVGIEDQDPGLVHGIRSLVIGRRRGLEVNAPSSSRGKSHRADRRPVAPS